MADAAGKAHFLVVLSFILLNNCADGQHDCHCTGPCDSLSGECLPPYSCSEGWAGSKCQKKNIALKQSASQSSVYCEGSASKKCYRASLAVDGVVDQDMLNGRGCSSTRRSSYNEWTITLGEQHYINYLTIFARQDCCSEDLNGFSVEVGGATCYQDSSGVPSGGIISVTCDKPVMGDKVTLKLNTPTEDVNLTLCEVQIWECDAGFFGKDCERECHCYRGASCDMKDGKCPIKKRLCARGWKGDNCATECPDNTYGSDCKKTCGHCWNDKMCAKINGSCPSDTDFTCKAGYTGPRCIKDCADGKWGEDCRFSCGHCEGNAVCDKKTGECPNRKCDKGWTGLRCKQDNSPCPDNKYGSQCEEDCGQCYGGKTCNRTSGHCPPGNPFCQPGFTGSLCKSECNAGLYGVDCQHGCGHCYDGKSCDIRSGACPNQPHGRRCSRGWKGPNCFEECPDGWYGVDCESQCSSNCRDKSGCNKTTGACPRLPGEPACEPGWSGPTCKSGCEFGTYGSECLEQCGRCHMGSCNSENGTCYKGKDSPRCQQGWHSAKCDQPCSKGLFGADCTKKCHCKGRVACDKKGLCPEIVTGERPCEPGYMGDKCDTACSSNLYGEGCRSVCGHCRDQRGCNVRTGACPLVAEQSICEDGWSGDLCITNARHDEDYEVIYICVGVVLTLLAIAAIVAFVIMRRRYIAKSHRRQENGQDPQQLFNLLPAEERNGGPPKPEKKPKRGFLRGKLTDEYCNVSDTFTSRAVAVDELLKFITDQNAVDGLKAEHESLPKGLTANTYEANKPENKPKNRFQGIVAYDHSRVVLNLKDGVPSSDYINACFVHGYTEQFRYIASQGPTALILDDFWRMVWQFDCTKIIMLTNLVEDARRKCDMYWPSSGDKEYGDISVTILETESLADFVIRTLSVRNIKDETMPSRIVKQFHFTVWPDHGVPNYPTALVHFREKVHTTNTTSTGPLIVHCSAGIGRTGTYIGLDYLIDQAKAENKVDVLQCVVNMRKQRVNMIQTEEQYAFLYEALAEAVLLSNMSIPASVFEEKYKELQAPHPDTGNTGLQEQFQMLATMSPTVTEAQCAGGSLPENKGRNRDSSILPVENWRPFLSTPAPNTTDYINAVFLPAYRDNHAFIATQMPLPHTTVDMWRLVYGQKSHCILMLNDLEALDEEKSVYWPYDNTTEGMFGPFKVTVVGVEKKATFDIQTMMLVYTKMPDKEPLKVKQLVAKFWKEGEDVPAKAEDLVSLIEEVERWRLQCAEGPVIVHCMNGADKSGLYCAISSVLERLKIDQEVNILQTVKQMRINRPQVIRNLKQYQFCFEAVLAFLESFQTYSNFK